MTEALRGGTTDDIAGLGQGDHVCAVYDDAAEQVSAMVDYVRRGLEIGERCLYIVDDRAVTDVCAALERAGVDVGDARSGKRLHLLTKRETYLSGGSFDPERMVQSLARSTEEAVADGSSGLRVTGEMTWALGPETGCDRLIEYETLLNRFFPGSRAHAICQYNRQRFSPAVIRDVLRTHPKAVIGKYVCPNLYYEPPELILAGDSDERRVQHMIGQLSSARAAQARLEELNQRLEEQTRALEQAVRSRDEFLSIASHELKTPLNALQLATDLLRVRAEQGGAEADEVVLPIRRQVGRLTALVEQLLDVTRLTEGGLEVERVSGDLFEIVRDAVRRFELDAEEAGCELRVHGRSIPGEWADVRIEQIVANLLSNALKYGDGAPIDVTVDVAGPLATLSVRDQGIGIAPLDHDRLFRRGERLSTARNHGGLGLGLWIVRQLALRMGGRVSVTSARGAGATFTVELPRTAQGHVNDVSA